VPRPNTPSGRQTCKASMVNRAEALQRSSLLATEPQRWLARPPFCLSCREPDAQVQVDLDTQSSDSDRRSRILARSLAGALPLLSYATPLDTDSTIPRWLSTCVLGLPARLSRVVGPPPSLMAGPFAIIKTLRAGREARFERSRQTEVETVAGPLQSFSSSGRSRLPSSAPGSLARMVSVDWVGSQK
jgi:hypothetical protein